MSSTASPSSKDLPRLEDLSYEQAFAELEGIIAALESEESSLEEALALYERGQGLVRFCTGLLDKAELKVQQLSGKELVDFDPDM
jgi:exodeoxyribonuclease VII small subunit